MTRDTDQLRTLLVACAIPAALLASILISCMIRAVGRRHAAMERVPWDDPCLRRRDPGTRPFDYEVD